MKDFKPALDPSIGSSAIDDLHSTFCRYRHEALKAFLAWAENHPAPNHLGDELEGTVSAFWGIAATVGAARPASGQ
jgi:hypothetical protein